MESRFAYPKNVPGDFYVEDGCCVSCNMPFTEAPDLFASADDGHCYVVKQPSSPAEVRRMTMALQVQDVGCIRYKGKNRVIQILLIGKGEGNSCDHLYEGLSKLNDEVQADRWGLNQDQSLKPKTEG